MFKYFFSAIVIATAAMTAIAPANAHGKDHGYKPQKGDAPSKMYQDYDMGKDSKDYTNDKNGRYQKDRTNDSMRKPNGNHKYGDYKPKDVVTDGIGDGPIIVIPIKGMPKFPIYTTPPYNPNPDASYQKDDNYDYGRMKRHGRKHHRNHGRMNDRYDRNDSYDDSYRGGKDDMKRRDYGRNYESQKPYPTYGDDARYPNQKPVQQIDKKPDFKPDYKPEVKPFEKPVVKNPDIKKPETKTPVVKIPVVKTPEVKKEVKHLDHKKMTSPMKKKNCK
jgi:hypothetical protein